MVPPVWIPLCPYPRPPDQTLHGSCYVFEFSALQGQSLAARVYMYNCYFTSLYLYKARFADIPEDVLADYSNSIQRITRAPRQSIPSSLTLNLSALGFPMCVRDLRVERRLPGR